MATTKSLCLFRYVTDPQVLDEQNSLFVPPKPLIDRLIEAASGLQVEAHLPFVVEIGKIGH